LLKALAELRACLEVLNQAIDHILGILGFVRMAQSSPNHGLKFLLVRLVRNQDLKQLDGKVPKGFDSIAHYCRAASGQYGNCDNPEQMHYYYKPAVEAHFAGLRGEKAPGIMPLFDKYAEGPVELPQELMFKGTTTQAVEEAMKFMAAQKVDGLAVEAKGVWEKLKKLWGPYAKKEKMEMPTSGAVIVSDDFASGAVDTKTWEGTHVLFIGDVAALHGKLSHAFEATDWTVEFRANMLSKECQHPQVNVTKPFGRRWAAIVCQAIDPQATDPKNSMIRFHGETEEAGRTYREAQLMQSDGAYHVYKIEKVGEEVSAYVDGQRKAGLPIESGMDHQWILEFGGYENMPLFLDWIVVTSSPK